ncbi:PKD domain-containing protein [Spirosoma arcticum]
MKFLWTFGDGTTSASPSPSHTFPTTQPAYTVTLSATNTCGTDSKQVSVPIKKTPVANYTTTGYTITNQDTVVCLNNGGTLTLDGTISLDESRYRWTISPGTYKFIGNTNSSSSVVKIQFEQSTDYTITLVALNDCGTSAPMICKHRVVNVPSVLIMPRLDACEATTYTLTNPTPNAIYTLNNGPNSQTLVPNQPVAVPVSASPYVVRGDLSNQCGPAQARPDTFYVQAPATVQIMTPARQSALCVATARVPLTTNLPGGSWEGSGKALIETQNGNSFFNPKTVGQYELIYVRGTGVCRRADTVRITVDGGQVTAQSVSSCDKTGFVKLQGSPAGGTWSSAAFPGAVRRDTLFLAGITAAQVELTYELNFGTAGCPAKTTATVTIGRPKAAFTVADACAGTPLTLANQSTGAGAFQWFVNNVATSAEREPKLTPTTGEVQIKLVALSGGCADTLSRSVTITATPVSPTVTPNTIAGCAPLNVTFGVAGLGQRGVTYRWDYGDGSTALPAPASQHTYLNPGRVTRTYTATLTAFNSCGTTAQSTILTVRPSAFAEIGVDSTNVRCTPATIRFSNRSVGEGQTSQWNFGDGTTRQTQQDTLLHRFSATDSARTFRVSLVVENSCGRDTDAVSIRVYPNLVRPLFNLTNARPCAGELVQFTDATVPRPTAWVWQFSDGTTETTPNPQHRFAEPNKVYSVTLTAYTPCGYSSLPRSLTTTSPPPVSFSISAPFICTGQAATLVNRSNPANQFRWNFGDGSPIDSVNFSPRHVFVGNSPSSIVSLTVIGATPGCSSTLAQPVSIRPVPKPDFTIEGGVEVCAPGPVRLVATDASASQFRWALSNGRVFTAPKPEVALPPGQYDVKLTVSYEQGVCADSSSRANAFRVLSCQAVTPEAFTPNGDALGDTWTLFGEAGIGRVARLRIWNRWGEVIFEAYDIPLNSKNPGECWDGTNRGVPMPAGQYTYEADVLLQADRHQKQSGSIALIR